MPANTVFGCVCCQIHVLNSADILEFIIYTLDSAKFNFLKILIDNYGMLFCTKYLKMSQNSVDNYDTTLKHLATSPI